MRIGISRSYNYYERKVNPKKEAIRQRIKEIANEAHPKYPYKLKDVKINKPNKVWSTDITYIKINGGIVYLAAIIDWKSGIFYP